MSPSPRRPPELHRKVFRGSVVVTNGQLTPNELRSRAWQRLFRDVYTCACVPVTHAVRAVAAASVLLPEAVVSGRSAAVLLGVDAARPLDDVEVTLPPGQTISATRGVRVRRRLLPSEAVVVRHRVRVTSPVVTALDIARCEPFDEAVVLLDRLVQRGVTSLGDVVVAASTATGPGCRQLRRVVAAADGLAESPQETRLRLVLHSSRLPRPVAQFSVYDATGFVARVDLAWPELRVAVEYEGRWHGERQNVARDRGGSTG